ncbi:DNA methyltransferase, partial [Acinetobacter pittii]|uniref:DNA methyltransferase n=1 Tax=Acinetobacter pittii TaxID=48296 RepID=UPI0033340EF9
MKLIYIDPPYNTGSDSFRYNDRFNHSTWLTFMKNRLEVAKELLADDGSIWINIDNEESAYLKILC